MTSASSWSGGRGGAKSSQALALRARIVLACAEGLAQQGRSRRGGVRSATVGKWRSPVRASIGLDGLVDEPRPGRPPSISAGSGRGRRGGHAGGETDERHALVAHVDGRTRPGCRSRRSGGSGGRSSSSRIASDAFKLSNDPLFVEKVYDIVGLYLQPARGRGGAVCGREVADPGSGPVPAGPADDAGHARAAHPRLRPPRHHQPVRGVRHRRRHRDLQRCTAATARSSSSKFLAKIDTRSPNDLDVHLICDNYGTHKHPTIHDWLAAHPRFHMHFTPTYSSWINQVERWFAYLTTTSSTAATTRASKHWKKDIRAWVKAWNENPKPFVWTKTAERSSNHSRDFYSELPAHDAQRAGEPGCSSSSSGMPSSSLSASSGSGRPAAHGLQLRGERQPGQQRDARDVRPQQQGHHRGERAVGVAEVPRRRHVERQQARSGEPREQRDAPRRPPATTAPAAVVAASS